MGIEFDHEEFEIEQLKSHVMFLTCSSNYTSANLPEIDETIKEIERRKQDKYFRGLMERVNRSNKSFEIPKGLTNEQFIEFINQLNEG